MERGLAVAERAPNTGVAAPRRSAAVTRVPTPRAGERIVDLAGGAIGALTLRYAEWRITDSGPEGGTVVATAGAPYAAVTGLLSFGPDGFLTGEVVLRTSVSALGLPLAEVEQRRTGWDPATGEPLVLPSVTATGGGLRIAADPSRGAAAIRLPDGTPVVPGPDGTVAVPLPAGLGEGLEQAETTVAAEQAVPAEVRSTVEALLGASLTGISLHVGPAASAALEGTAAAALVSGRDVYLAARSLVPASAEEARALLAGVTKALAGAAGPVVTGDAVPDPAQAEASPVPPPASTPVAEPSAEGAELPTPAEAEVVEGERLPEAAIPGEAEAPAGETVVAPEGEVSAEPEAEIQLLMPPAPAAPPPAQQERITRVGGSARRAARSATDLPPAESAVGAARGAVTEPPAETAARARADLTAALGQRPEPSPEIVALCGRIRTAIRERRPVDEDELTSANPQEAAKEAGQELDQSIQTDAQRVEQSYDELNSPPAGSPQLKPSPLQAPGEGVPDPGIEAGAAAPDAIPNENLSLDADRDQVQAKVDESRIERPTTEPLTQPPFSTVREGQAELRQLAETKPGELSAEQQQAIATAQTDMAELQSRALAALNTSRAGTTRSMTGRQAGMVESEEETRRRISTEAQGIFDDARTQVTGLLQPLTPKAMQRWDAGVAALSVEFRGSLDQVQGWIDERHSGVGGFFLSGLDALTGLPDWVTEAYDRAEQRFGDGVCELLTEISRDVNAIVAAAQAVIDNARTRIDDLFANLPEGLREWAAGEQARFQQQLNGLERQVTEARTSFVQQVSQRAVAAVAEVQAEVEALREAAKGLIGKVLDAIQAFIDDPVRAIINGFLTLVGIPPAAFWALVDKIAQVISDIAEDPMLFVNNLVEALKQGFEGFFERFGEHVIQGFWDWLFSALGSVGLRLPKDSSVGSIVTFALQIMGITWPRIREILVRHVGEDNVALVEKAWELVSTLVQQGPEGLFEMLKQQLDPARIVQEILKAAVEYLVEALIKQVAVRVLALLNPVGAIVQAIELIYKVLKWVFQNAARIFRLVETVVNGIADILAGNIGAMALAIEKALASLVPLVIGFLADLLGLGDLPLKVADVIGRLQEFVLGIVDQVIAWLVGKGKALLAAFGLGVDEEDEKGGADDTELGEEVSFSAAGESHKQWIELVGEDAVLMVASASVDVNAKLDEWEGEADSRFGENEELLAEVTALIQSGRTLASEANVSADALAEAYSHAAELSEEALPSDNAVEQKQIALSRVLGKLFEHFGGDPEKLLKAIGRSLPARGKEIVPDIHDRWKQRIEPIQIGNEEDDEFLWTRTVLTGTQSGALDYTRRLPTHEQLLPYLTAAPGERELTTAAFREYAFVQQDVTHNVREGFLSALGGQAKVALKAQAHARIDNNTKLDPEYKQKLKEKVEKIAFYWDSPGGGRWELPTERIPDHSRYKPKTITTTPSGAVVVTEYETYAGQKFTITADKSSGLTKIIEGLELRVMSGRGVTEDSPWFTSGQGFNRAHLIANEFGGSGFAEGENLATTSATYNQQVMRGAEILIGRSIRAFADHEKLDKGAVRFTLIVTVTFGALRDAEVLARIKQQPWYKGPPDLDALIVQKIKAGEVHPELMRVTSVVYKWTSVTPPGLEGSTSIGEDIYLLAE
jgi:hypothetical protein